MAELTIIPGRAEYSDPHQKAGISRRGGARGPAGAGVCGYLIHFVFCGIDRCQQRFRRMIQQLTYMFPVVSNPIYS